MSGSKINDSFVITKNSHEDSVKTIFESLLKDGEFTDVTLSLSDDKQIRGHRAILAASSNFFRKIFKQNSTSGLYLKEVDSVDMNSIMEFIYLGQTSVNKADLTTFLQAAEHLQIEGLIQPGEASISDMNVSKAFESLPEPVVSDLIIDEEKSISVEDTENHQSLSELQINDLSIDEEKSVKIYHRDQPYNDFNESEERIRPSCSLDQKIFESHEDEAGDKEGGREDDDEESLDLENSLESTVKLGSEDVKISDDDFNELEERIRSNCSQGQKILKSDEDEPGDKEEDEDERFEDKEEGKEGKSNSLLSRNFLRVFSEPSATSHIFGL